MKESKQKGKKTLKEIGLYDFKNKSGLQKPCNSITNNPLVQGVLESAGRLQRLQFHNHLVLFEASFLVSFNRCFTFFTFLDQTHCLKSHLS
jgi:hypothetical protein